MSSENLVPAKADAPPRVGVIAYTEYLSDPRVRREAETLARSGYDVFVIALRPNQRSPGQDTGGVHVIEIPLIAKRGSKVRYLYQYSMFLLLSTAVLTYLGTRHRFSLVHVHSLPDFQLFCALPLFVQKTPVILDLHEAMPEIFAARFRLSMDSTLIRLAILLEQLSCRVATHVITANDAIRARVVSRGTPANHVTVVYNAPTLAPAAIPSPDLRTRFGLPEAHLIVHAGGINRERDLETLLTAVALLPESFETFVIVAGHGEPGYVRELTALAGRLNIRDRVKFVGELTPKDAKDLLTLSEVGVVTLEDNPLTRIALPTRVIEFASLSKPLVLPGLPYLEEVIGEGAEYYVPGDPENLRKVLGDVLAHLEKRQARTEMARRICEKFDWGRNQTSFLGICAALGGRRAP